MNAIDMSVNLAGIAMKNPITVASGTFAAGREFSDIFDISSLGAVTTKGVSSKPWEGNASPQIGRASCRERV